MYTLQCSFTSHQTFSSPQMHLRTPYPGPSCAPGRPQLRRPRGVACSGRAACERSDGAWLSESGCRGSATSSHGSAPRPFRGWTMFVLGEEHHLPVGGSVLLGAGWGPWCPCRVWRADAQLSWAGTWAHLSLAPPAWVRRRESGWQREPRGHRLWPPGSRVSGRWT